jgi:predicted ABC-type transport system involved in lysophospholipase L1 biosynthesis ATPase subunit
MHAQSAPLIEARSLEPWGSDGLLPLPALDYRIGESGTVCIIGNQSAMLSAYLRVLGGVDSARRGELYLFGQPLHALDLTAWRELRQRIGFVTHRAPLLSVFNGLENVLLPALYHKRFSRHQAEERARVLIDQLHCHANLKLLPAYLSPLERTQLAIARAAMLEPPVIFLEEPFHELDIGDYEEINEFLRAWALHHSLVMSTRNLHFVRHSANRIIFAGNRGIHYFDSWQALSESPAEEPQSYLRHYKQIYEL